MLSEPEPVESLLGIGPRSAGWLRRVGFATAADVRAAGAVAAYLRVEQAGLRPGRNLLWALHGALHNKHWTAVTESEKTALEAELASWLKGA